MGKQSKRRGQAADLSISAHAGLTDAEHAGAGSAAGRRILVHAWSEARQ